MGKTELKRCIILGGGDINNYAAIAAEIDATAFVICADGGFSHCEKLGIKPDLLVGDFDSIAMIPEEVERLDYPVDKDYTDSTLAIRVATERGCDDIVLGGMLGGRFDHSVGNLQNLAWCAQNGIKAKITDGVTEVYAVKNGKITLPPRENVYFSVFSFVDECGSVTITGAKYPLTAYPLRFDDPRAVSNEFAGQNAVVTVENGMVAVIIAPK